MPKQQGLYFQTTVGYTRPKCSGRQIEEEKQQTTQIIPQRFVEETKTIFLCFRMPLWRKWRWRPIWTLMEVLRTFLSNGQTAMPQTKKNPNEPRLGAFQNLNDHWLTRKFWQFWLVFFSQSYCLIKCSNWIGQYVFFNPINSRLVFLCWKILIRSQRSVPKFVFLFCNKYENVKSMRDGFGTFNP